MLFRSTDYAEGSSTVIKAADLPSLSLSGPKLIRDDWRMTQHTTDTLESGTFESFWPPWTVMFEYELTGAADTKAEAVALSQSVIEFFMRNGYLRPDIVPSDPALGREQLPLHLLEFPEVIPGASGSNLTIFTATFHVRGIDFFNPEPFSETKPVTEFRSEERRVG